MDACAKCGGPLFVDQQSVIQLARSGFEGARIYCRAGCTDVWLKRRVVTIGRAVPPERRGVYRRRVRTFECEICGRRGETLGHTTRWCLSCRPAAIRAREQARYARRHPGGRRRRASAA